MFWNSRVGLVFLLFIAVSVLVVGLLLKPLSPTNTTGTKSQSNQTINDSDLEPTGVVSDLDIQLKPLLEKYPIRENHVFTLCAKELDEFCPDEILFKSKIACLNANRFVISLKCESELDEYYKTLLPNYKSIYSICKDDFTKSCPNLKLDNLNVKNFVECLKQYKPSTRSALCTLVLRKIHD